MAKYIKIILGIIVVLLFLASLPAVFSNSKIIDRAKNEVKSVIDGGSKICKSNCTDYPDDWVIDGKKEEAEQYCVGQCANNMLSFREELNSQFEVKFENNYYLFVARAACILGLKCFSTEIKDYINNYRP